ncbi:MAG: hypothetical protein JJ900_00595 [Rhodospirillales bacterium]|nr:hypothetical protein [Rhodospirillales bacterium]MBO6785315.1 hypothetical protein [Rhodospirillales bacterium]
MTFRYPIYAMTLAAFVAVAPVSGALAGDQDMSVEQIKEDTSELVTSLKEFGVEQRDEAVDAVEGALDAIDDRIVALETRVDHEWDEMSQAARESARETLRALREERQDVAEWLGGLKNTTGEAWAEVKADFSEAYKDMSEAWDKAERELGEGA